MAGCSHRSASHFLVRLPAGRARGAEARSSGCRLGDPLRQPTGTRRFFSGRCEKGCLAPGVRLVGGAVSSRRPTPNCRQRSCEEHKGDETKSRTARQHEIRQKKPPARRGQRGDATAYICTCAAHGRARHRRQCVCRAPLQVTAAWGVKVTGVQAGRHTAAPQRGCASVQSSEQRGWMRVRSKVQRAIRRAFRDHIEQGGVWGWGGGRWDGRQCHATVGEGRAVQTDAHNRRAVWLMYRAEDGCLGRAQPRREKGGQEVRAETRSKECYTGPRPRNGCLAAAASVEQARGGDERRRALVRRGRLHLALQQRLSGQHAV